MRLEYCAIVAGHDPTQSFADLENLNLATHRHLLAGSAGSYVTYSLPFNVIGAVFGKHHRPFTLRTEGSTFYRGLSRSR